MLEAYGIHVTLFGFYHGTSTWHHLGAIGGLQIWVLDTQAAAATELMANPPPSSDYVEPSFERPSYAAIALATLVFVMAGLPLPLWARKRQY